MQNKHKGRSRQRSKSVLYVSWTAATVSFMAFFGLVDVFAKSGTSVSQSSSSTVQTSTTADTNSFSQALPPSGSSAFSSSGGSATQSGASIGSSSSSGGGGFNFRSGAS